MQGLIAQHLDIDFPAAEENVLKITGAKTRAVLLPTNRALAAVGVEPEEKPRPRGAVILELGTSEGIWGLGYVYLQGDLKAAQAFKATLDELARLIVGEDPIRAELISEKLRAAGEGFAKARASAQAIGVIDVALWDIAGKAAGQPVAKLLGGHRDRVPTYVSGTLRFADSMERLGETSQRLVKHGFRAVKIMAGQGKVDRELEKVAAVRHAIGDDTKLMVDINQNWSLDQADEMGRQMEPYQLSWLEEPIQCDDFQGMARLAQTLTTPLVAGEHLESIVSFREMFEARCVNFATVSVLHVGGFTQARKIAGMAEAFGLPVVNFHLPELSVHLISAIPNGLTVEYTPWALPLFKEAPVLERGELIVPQKPGLGLELDEDAIRLFEKE